MQSGAFWDTILRNVTVCALTSSRLDDFSDIVNLYTVRIAIFFGGSWAFFWGESFYRSNTLERTLLISPDCPEVGNGWGGWPCEQRRGGGGGGESGKWFLWRRTLFWAKTSGKHSPRFLNRSTTVICKYPWRHVFIFAYNVVNATCAVITGQVKFCWPKVPTIRTLSRLSKSWVNLQHTQETTVASLETEPDFTLWPRCELRDQILSLANFEGQ